jgi:hypothetical protein
METYLNPAVKPGCGNALHDEDCLCDVDMSRAVPLGDRSPACLVHAETAEDLVFEGAKLWQQLDLPRLPYREEASSTDPEVWALVIQACKEGATLKQAERAAGCTVDKYYWTYLRALFSPNGPRYQLPDARILELWSQGLTGPEIIAQVNQEGSCGHTLTRHGLWRSLHRQGVRPRPSRRRPRQPVESPTDEATA